MSLLKAAKGVTELWCSASKDGYLIDQKMHILRDAIAHADLPKPNAESEELRRFFIEVDSELSAIASGRPPSSKEELLRLSDFARNQYDANRAGKGEA
jgi:hypothetical protein